MQRTTAALLGAAVVAFAAVFVAGAAPALAHDLPPNIRTVLDRVEPRTTGVTMQVVQSVADQIVASNTTPNDLEVFAPTGEVFLRIGPSGVFANLNSPTWYLTSSVEGTVSVPARAQRGATPEFARVSSATSMGWFDHRLHPARIPTPRGKKEQRLLGWSIPMRWNGQPLTASGHLEYAVPKGSVVAEVTRNVIADGVSVAVAAGRVPALFMRVTGGHAVTVLGERGEPMVRVTSAGVEANDASPSWRFTAASKNQLPTGVIDATAPPHWVPVSRGGSFSWLEPRARYAPGEPPASIQDRKQPAVLTRFTVPVNVDGSRHDIDGIVRWQPLASAGRGGWSSRQVTAAVVAGIGALAILGSGASLLRQRRRTKMVP